MNDKQQFLKRVPIYFGIGLGLFYIMQLVVFYLMKVDIKSPIRSWTIVLSLFVTIIAIVWAQLAFKKQNSGIISFEQGLKIGLTTILIAASLNAVYKSIHHTYISPETIEQYFEIIEQETFKKEPKLNEEDIRPILNVWRNFMTKPYLSIPVDILKGLFFGFIISLITAAIVRSKPQNS